MERIPKQYYTTEFKEEAVKLVTDGGLKVVEVNVGFNYIEVYYNRQRKHSTNCYKSPAYYELEWWDNRKAA